MNEIGTEENVKKEDREILREYSEKIERLVITLQIEICVLTSIQFNNLNAMVSNNEGDGTVGKIKKDVAVSHPNPLSESWKDIKGMLEIEVEDVDVYGSKMVYLVTSKAKEIIFKGILYD